jgi:DNA-binding NarL/FixJ family response regulator
VRDEKTLVVLEEIERDGDRLVGSGRAADGSRVAFPVDDVMLVAIVRTLALTTGASVWVPRRVLRARPEHTAPEARPSEALPVPEAATAAAKVERATRSVLVSLPESLVGSLVGTTLAGAGYATRLVPPQDGLRSLATDGFPHAIVLDVVGEPENGVALGRRLLDQAPHLGLVYLTRLPDARFVGEELPTGRRVAFLHVGSTPDVGRLTEAVDAVIQRRAGRELRDDLRPDRPLGVLSNRQLWLLGQLARGLLLADIAGSRGVSERGAQRLLSRTYARLGIVARQSGHARSLAVRRYCDAAGMAPVALPEVSLP